MPDEFFVRLQRLELLRSNGVDPYPSEVTRTHMFSEVLSGFQGLLESQTSVFVVGRLRLIRKHGGLTFIHLQDGSATMQVALKRDMFGEEAYDFFHKTIDIGDFLQLTGVVFLTKKGEQTILASSYALLSKSLQPLPEKWHGLTDVEARYRQRELDLIVHPEVRERFIKRSKLISFFRHFLDTHGFLEVETPILQSIPGGASARPFVTHYHALNAQFYLRIAPELYLKRLLVGGFEKIYEIGKVFRNEGIDYAHNPEFTMLEFYWAFCKSRDTFIDFLEELIRTAIQHSIGSLRIPYGEWEIDFGVDWPRKTFRQAIIDACGIDIDEYKTESVLIAEVKKNKLNIDFSECVGMGEHYDKLYKKTAREKIASPTWIFDYPLELKPLTKASPDDATKSASVQLVVHSMEIVNAYYHELIDPIDQRQRFLAQETLRERGSQEAQFVDEEFLSALEHAMPPTSGVGIGIDRFIAFLTNAPNLKEVILFPTLRSRTDDRHHNRPVAK
jgi:lysyl-tRNA synthetase class 2